MRVAVSVKLKALSTFSKVAGVLGAAPPGRPPQRAKLLFVQKGRRGTVGRKEYQQGLGTASIHKCMDASSLRCANLPKKVGGVPGTGFRYTSFYTRLAYVGICLFHSWLRSGRAAPTFFIAKKVGKEALKGEPLDVFWGRGRFPLENPSPVLLEKL